jgi:hypothetical protein
LVTIIIKLKIAVTDPSINIVLRHTDSAYNQRNNEVNLKIFRTVVNFTIKSALCKCVCYLVQRSHIYIDIDISKGFHDPALSYLEA